MDHSLARLACIFQEHFTRLQCSGSHEISFPHCRNWKQKSVSRLACITQADLEGNHSQSAMSHQFWHLNSQSIWHSTSILTSQLDYMRVSLGWCHVSSIIIPMVHIFGMVMYRTPYQIYMNNIYYCIRSRNITYQYIKVYTTFAFILLGTHNTTFNCYKRKTNGAPSSSVGNLSILFGWLEISLPQLGI